LFEKHPELGILPPAVNAVALPEEERLPTCEHVSYAAELWTAVRKFSHAVALFDHSSSTTPPKDDWKLLAARDGAWSVYNFGYAMRGFREGMRDLPTLRKAIDHSAMKRAQHNFEEAFPDYEELRNALGHFTETNKNEAMRARNYYAGPFVSDGMRIEGERTQVLIKESLRGRVFQTTRNGKLLSYEISSGSLRALVEAKDLFYSGILPFALETWSLPHFEPTKSTS
jgi:hypothetical protein